MASLNKIFLIGNLTRNPDLRGTPGGASICELGLAVNRRYTSNGQEKEEVVFIDVNAWGKIAESCHRNLSKGSQIMVEGRLTMDQWQDRNSGETRRKIIVTADNIQFLPSSNRNQSAENSSGNSSGGIDPSYAPGGYGNNGRW
jgi:single-strand DNA-binding protein